MTLIVLATLTVTSSAAGDEGWPPKDGQVLDGIVALVGNEPITRYELERATGPFVQRLRANGEVVTEAHASRVQKEVLQSLVDERLMLEEARRMKLEVSPTDIDRELENIKTERGWDDAQLAAVLVQTGFPTIASFREHRRKQRLIDQVLNFRVRGRSQVDEAEVKAAVAAELGGDGSVSERRAAHILVKADEFVTEERVAEIKNMLSGLHDKITAGDITFEDAARTYSEDPAGRAGGDTGWFKKGEFVASFEAAIRKLRVGEMSGVVQTEFGFHLIKLIDERQKAISEADREALTARVRMRMVQEVRTRLYDRWLRSLRRDAFIEIRSGDDAQAKPE